MKSPSSSGATPPLLSSPATLTSTSTSVSGVGVPLELRESAVAGDRVDQPHQRQEPLDLAALQVADEVPLERVAPALLLGLQVLQPVLADQRHAGLGERAHLVAGHVLGRREDLDLRARRSRAPAPGSRGRAPGRARGSAQPSQAPAWRPVRSPSRRWEKKSSGLQLVHSPLTSTARRRRARGGVARPRAGRACGRRRRPLRAARSVEHLIAHLVAARPDPGPDRRAPCADGRHAALDDPRRQPAPAAVEHRHARRARERDGRQSATKTSGASPAARSPARRPRRAPGPARRTLGLGRRVMHRTSAPWTWRPISTRSGSRPSAAASRWRFSRTASRSSPVSTAEVEALERRRADAAEAGAERGAGSRQLGLQPATPSRSRQRIATAALPASFSTKPAQAIVELDLDAAQGVRVDQRSRGP